MESNGVKGRIQVSQATADALIENGKEAWLVPREEKVQAKGKGEMQTYFITIEGGTSTVGNEMQLSSTTDTDAVDEE